MKIGRHCVSIVQGTGKHGYSPRDVVGRAVKTTFERQSRIGQVLPSEAVVNLGGSRPRTLRVSCPHGISTLGRTTLHMNDICGDLKNSDGHGQAYVLERPAMNSGGIPGTQLDLPHPQDLPVDVDAY